MATPARARRAALQVVRTSKFEASNEFAEELRETAKYIATRGRGILASDESNATTGKRLATVGVENTEDNRRAWRECLYTAPGLGQYISGAMSMSLRLHFQHARMSPGYVNVLFITRGTAPKLHQDCTA